MNPNHIRQELKSFYAHVNQSSTEFYQWLRWLVMLCAAFFSFMATQLSGKSFQPDQLLALKIALSLTALGILSGVICLFGEIQAGRRLQTQYHKRAAHIIDGNHVAADNVQLVGRPSWLARESEKVCYASLLLSLASWVAFVWLM